MSDDPRPLDRDENQLLDIAMLVSLGGVEERDLPALGVEVLRLLPQAPFDSRICGLLDRLGALAEAWEAGGIGHFGHSLHLRQECAQFFRMRYVRHRRPAHGGRGG